MFEVFVLEVDEEPTSVPIVDSICGSEMIPVKGLEKSVHSDIEYAVISTIYCPLIIVLIIANTQAMYIFFISIGLIRNSNFIA
jgi:hypothetical protein